MSNNADITLTSSQQHILRAMVLAGSSEEVALEKVLAFGRKENSKISNPNSLICPRCRGTMRLVALADKRTVRYCPNDRITLPLKAR